MLATPTPTPTKSSQSFVDASNTPSPLSRTMRSSVSGTSTFGATANVVNAGDSFSGFQASGTSGFGVGAGLSNGSDTKQQTKYLPNYLLQNQRKSNDFGTSKRDTDNPFASVYTPKTSLGSSAYNTSGIFGINRKEEGFASRSRTYEGHSNMPEDDLPPADSMFDLPISSASAVGGLQEMPSGMDVDRGSSGTLPQATFSSQYRPWEQPNHTLGLSSLEQGNRATQPAAMSGVLSDQPVTVTVFGFPLEQAGHVLTDFRQYGDILDYEPAPSGGNWLRITYSSHLAAEKALAKNGQLVDGKFIVGVVKGQQQTGLISNPPTSAPLQIRNPQKSGGIFGSTNEQGSATGQNAANSAKGQQLRAVATPDIFKRPETAKGWGSGYVAPGLEGQGGLAWGQIWNNVKDYVFGF